MSETSGGSQLDVKPVAHPNFIPDSVSHNSFMKGSLTPQDNSDVRSKPPSGANGSHVRFIMLGNIWSNFHKN